jgi:putative hydrolase of the HAD superfamily
MGLPGSFLGGPFRMTIPMRFLDRFKVVLLDMNGTFMFGEDRFGPGENFAATYRDLGGKMLTDVEVERAVRATYDLMASDYENPAKYDDFRQVADVLRSLHPSLPGDELTRIEDVMAIHELGHVTDAYAGHLRRLAETHRLGLVANIWCKKDRWLNELERAGVLDLFEFPVFSSDHKSMKLSSVLFDLAFQPFSVRKEEVVFVGDSVVNDIEGAKGLGISAVWINRDGHRSACADHVVSDLADLVG